MRLPCLRRTTLSAALVLLLTAPLAAQEAEDAADVVDEGESTWVTASAGAGTPQRWSLGFGAAFGRRFCFQFGFNANDDVYSFERTVESLHAAAGLKHRLGPRVQTSLFAGPALVRGFARRSAEQGRRNERYTFGALVNAQLYVKPFRRFGFGVELYGNLNGLRSCAGVRAGILIGKG